MPFSVQTFRPPHAVVRCHNEQLAAELWDAVNEIVPELLEKVHGLQNPRTGAEQMVFCYDGEYQLDDWQFGDPSVTLPERQSDDDPALEFLTSELAGTRMEEAENWDHVYGIPIESISPLSWDEIDLLIECVQRVYSLHYPESEQDSEDTPLEEDSTIPEELIEEAPVTANWLFESFRETILSLQATDQQRTNLFQPILVTLLCDGFSDASCRHEFIGWLTKFMSRFE